ERAAATITTVEVTTAGASRRADGIDVKEGDAIVLVDGSLVASGDSIEEVLLAGLDRAVNDGALVTIYGGEAVSETEIEAAANSVRTRWHDVEVETHRGGQPLYHYVASVE